MKALFFSVLLFGVCMSVFSCDIQMKESIFTLNCETVNGIKMEKVKFKKKYPVLVKEYPKNEIFLNKMDDICQYFVNKIKVHEFAESFQFWNRSLKI
jgi:hypothetical protein